jgi:hypothetical protein
MVACTRLDKAGGVGRQVLSLAPDLTAAPVGISRFAPGVLVFVL